MAHIQSGLKTAALMLKGRMPGQLVIQITDRCNATCPQCSMRKTNKFDRTRLTNDQLKEIIDAAGEKGFQAISFTGGEPMLLRRDLPGLIRHAGKAGIPYIRTGTNGFFFAGHDKPDFKDKVKAIADELSDTPLRNFWISLDSKELQFASFRPCRYQQRPCNSDCLPPGRCDACLPQAGFARHAGQTKKEAPVNGASFLLKYDKDD